MEKFLLYLPGEVHNRLKETNKYGDKATFEVCLQQHLVVTQCGCLAKKNYNLSVKMIKTCIQSWTKDWRQIHEIKQNSFFYGMFYS